MNIYFIILLMSINKIVTTQNEVLINNDRLESINNDTMMIHKYTAYNLWANQQMANWMEGLPDSLFEKEIESSFSSLRKTVEHLWNAEAGWLNHIQDLSWGESPSKNFLGTPNEILTEWLKVSEAFNNYVQNMTEEQLMKTKANSSGGGFTSYIEMIHHCMNHSTYHRGQIITLGRQLGLQNPPRTDFIYYIRVK